MILLRGTSAFLHKALRQRRAFVPYPKAGTAALLFSSDDTTSSSNNDTDTVMVQSPWHTPLVVERVIKKRKRNKARFRQHVNPLARIYQRPTELSKDWPRNVLDDCTKPLHVDIGCGKGGFLIDSVKAAVDKEKNKAPVPFNYLGLEIRPGVAQYAKERIAVHGMTGVLEFVGCNANVDLERLLQRYHDANKESSTSSSMLLLELASIQFPDPHFKSQHAKRRVVTADLIRTLAKFMPADGQVFLQSDVQTVLDDMRQRFREDGSSYFEDTMEHLYEYLPDNPLGVPTEREVSVLVQNKPVYRSMFRRTETTFQELSNQQ